MPHPNVYTDSFDYDPEDPPGYEGGVARIGEQAGAQESVVKLFELNAGQKLCPYHYEFVEEWLILLEGELDVRTPGGTERIGRGDVLCFPAGPDGAHAVANPGDGPARLLMFSSAQEPSVAVYPDSDKVGVWAGELALMFRRGEGQVPYYEGETA